MESDHLTILVWYIVGALIPITGYQPEEGLMSLIHYAHEDETPP